MADVSAKVAVHVDLKITDKECDELVEQLMFLVEDNRSTQVTQLLLDALKGLGF